MKLAWNVGSHRSAGEARQARPDDAGNHAAGSDIGDRLGRGTGRAPARPRRSGRAACWRRRSPASARPGTSPGSCRCRARTPRTMAPHTPGNRAQTEAHAPARDACISNEAGNTESMTPRCCRVTGRLAHMRRSAGTIVSTAKADEANISVLLPWVSAGHTASRPMFRNERRGRISAAARASLPFIAPHSRRMAEASQANWRGRRGVTPRGRADFREAN